MIHAWSAARGRVLLVSLALVLLAIVLVRTAWVCDDAYITFRVLDNAVSGLGLRWNPLDRVQVYTHPLWLLLLLPLYALTREIWLTSMATGAVLSLGVAAWLSLGLARSTGQALLLVAALIASAAYVDFSTSGLENSLAHLLLLGFAAWLWRARPTGRDQAALVFLAALVTVNRLDHSLLVAPALLWSLSRLPWRERAIALLAGGWPLLAWLSFALVYYGSLVPNTAPAKLGAGLPLSALALKGLWYLRNSLVWDPVTLTTVACAALYAIFARRTPEQLLLLGVAIFLAYVVRAGGDHMSGRFLTAPFVISLAVLSRSAPSPRALAGTALLVLGLGAMARNPPLSSGPDLYLRDLDPQGIVDERGFYYVRTGLLAPGLWAEGPVQSWREEAAESRARGPHAEKRAMIGFYGYYVGPTVHLIDPLGLGDPLLARLPMEDFPDFRPGHYHRKIPRGWMKAALGNGELSDPDLARLWRRLSLLTRGPLWSLDRWYAIWQLHTGQLRPLVERWCERERARWQEGGGKGVAPCRQ